MQAAGNLPDLLVIVVVIVIRIIVIFVVDIGFWFVVVFLVNLIFCVVASSSYVISRCGVVVVFVIVC